MTQNGEKQNAENVGLVLRTVGQMSEQFWTNSLILKVNLYANTMTW